MAEVQITLLPPAEVEIQQVAPAAVDLITAGVQGPPGPQGPPGTAAENADPGDLILYLQNGLT